MGRRYRAHIAQRNNQAVVRKKNRSIITTVLAFSLVMFVIPMAFGLADVVNGAVAESSQKKILQVDDFGHQALYTARTGGIVSFHSNVSGTVAADNQIVYDGDTLGKNYNQLIVSYSSPTEYATRSSVVYIQCNLSTQWMIAHNIVFYRVSLNTSSVKQLSLSGGSYAESSGTLFYIQDSAFKGNVGGGAGERVALPVEPYGTLNATWSHDVGADIHVNTSSMHWTVVDVDMDATNLLKADTYLESAVNSTFCIALTGTGDTDGTSVINGDSIKFRIEFFGSAVSGVVISEYMVGGLGVLLILGSAVASPWVNPTRRG